MTDAPSTATAREIDVAYQPSSQLDERPPADRSSRRSPPITVQDGRGGSAHDRLTPMPTAPTTSPQRRFLGFADETEILPCIAGETACPTIARMLSQDFAAVGRGHGARRCATARSDILRETERRFTANNATLPYTALLSTRRRAYHYEVAGLDGRRPTSRRASSFAYDAYGNVCGESDLRPRRRDRRRARRSSRHFTRTRTPTSSRSAREERLCRARARPTRCWRHRLRSMTARRTIDDAADQRRPDPAQVT